MDLTEAVEYCLSLPEVEQTSPFGPEVIVFKVAGKMFALTDPDDLPPRMNLKCDPTRAEELRSQHESINPGYHMNKRHWNTIQLVEELPSQLVSELILHSYTLVVQGLKKAERERIIPLLKSDTKP